MAITAMSLPLRLVSAVTSASFRLLGVDVDQDQVRRLLVQGRFKLDQVGRARRAQADAAIAQHADQMFGFFDRIFDQDQFDDVVLLAHWARRSGVEGFYSIPASISS